MPTMTFDDRSNSSAPVAEPPAQDVTMPAFRAEVASEAFWEAVQRRRAARSPSEKLEIAAGYRRQRAERAAAELRS